MFNPNDAVYQQGMYLYETQCIYANIEAGKIIDLERTKETCRRYCELINATGILRAEYISLEDRMNKLENLIKSIV